MTCEDCEWRKRRHIDMDWRDCWRKKCEYRKKNFDILLGVKREVAESAAAGFFLSALLVAGADDTKK